MMVGKNRFRSFATIQDRVWSRVSNWKNIFLSQADKEVLLKSIVQVISTYTMSIFLLPRKTCKDIASTMAKFWWGNRNKSFGIHWKKWTFLGNTKSKGGLGFRDLKAFNTDLLVKQLWRIVMHSDSLA